MTYRERVLEKLNSFEYSDEPISKGKIIGKLKACLGKDYDTEYYKRINQTLVEWEALEEYTNERGNIATKLGPSAGLFGIKTVRVKNEDGTEYECKVYDRSAQDDVVDIVKMMVEFGYEPGENPSKKEEIVTIPEEHLISTEEVFSSESLPEDEEIARRDRFTFNSFLYSCSLSEMLVISQQDLTGAMREKWCELYKTRPMLGQYMAWGNELKTLKDQLSQIPEQYRGWGIVFERIFGLNRRHRHMADSVVLTKNYAFVLEFKMTQAEQPDQEAVKQVHGYAKSIRNHFRMYQPDKIVIPIVVLSMTVDLNGKVKCGNDEVLYCSGNNLLSTMLDEMKKTR